MAHGQQQPQSVQPNYAPKVQVQHVQPQQQFGQQAMYSQNAAAMREIDGGFFGTIVTNGGTIYTQGTICKLLTPPTAGQFTAFCNSLTGGGPVFAFACLVSCLLLAAILLKKGLFILVAGITHIVVTFVGYIMFVIFYAGIPNQNLNVAGNSNAINFYTDVLGSLEGNLVTISLGACVYLKGLAFITACVAVGMAKSIYYPRKPGHPGGFMGGNNAVIQSQGAQQQPVVYGQPPAVYNQQQPIPMAPLADQKV
ncbi:hypothetical protein HK101_003769 [Irineochytrium annulatum]|nr:hypothetical protein HK101_003769 [Irineochytrium annulatum]